MAILLDIARLAAAANVLLLAGLTYVWGRNAATFGTKHTYGLVTFSVLLLVENALAFYYYLIDPTLSVWYSTQVPVIVWRVTMVLHVLETAGLLVLTWVTWD